MSDIPIIPPALDQFITASKQLNGSSVNNLGNLTNQLAELQTWQQQLLADLRRNRLDASPFSPQGNITEKINEFNQWFEDSALTRQTSYQALITAQDLGEQLDSKVIFLVFGKFNAGKSSLCNLLADCFDQAQQSVQYFYIQDGDIILTDAIFQEGVTETTARLQGVYLGEQLVLLDTPGLHSLTAINAALTERFMESADGVLWLSSSSSPGQVHELDTLSQELHRQKPLLPIITRSDYLEEDVKGGEICHVLCNKSPSQRQLQEQDVQTRAIRKLEMMAVDTTLLKPTVSISAHMAKYQNCSAKAMEDAGIDRLLLALLDLIKPAINYKQRKPAEIFLHYLQEQVFDPLQEGLENRVSILNKSLTKELDNLESYKATMIEQVWRTILPRIPDLMDSYHPLYNVDNLLSDIAYQTQKQLQTRINETLTNSQVCLDNWHTLRLINPVVYQNDEGNSNLPLANEVQLYKNICDSLVVLLQQTLDNVIKEYHAQIQTLLSNVNRLQAIEADYRNRLISLSIDIRRKNNIYKQ